MPVDFLIVGGGTAGCALASRLSEAGADVLLLEAGGDTPPDAVPADIRDTFPRSYYNPAYTWRGLEATLTASARAPVPFPQARLIGGGSALAGMVALRGLPADFDAWEAAGADGWGPADVLPVFGRVEHSGGEGRIPLRRFRPAEWPAFTRAVGEAAAARGYAFVDDLNADASDGYGPLPLMRTATERVSAASAYLDPAARRRPNLTIASRTTVLRLRFRAGRCTGVDAWQDRAPAAFEADRVVLCAGAIQSPALLLRSGVGPAEQLRGLGIPVEAALAGVGRHLQNHPVAYLATHLRPTARQAESLRAQFVAGLRFSSAGETGERGDMLLLVLNRSSWHRLGESVAGLGVGLLRPRSRGAVTLASSDPGVQPRIRFEMLSDAADAARMVEGLRLALALMQDDGVRHLRHELFTAAYSETVRRLNRPGVASRIGTGLLAAALDGPGALRHALVRHGIAGGEVDEARMSSDAWLADTVARRTFGMYHPAGTCRIGRPDDPDAVVDPGCSVHGVDGLSVADASVMPALVRGTPNLAVLMIAERVADALLGHRAA
jgi:5-(hydroxymethyl)furfural/furfural oxidase